MGKTAPSVAGLRNLFECQLVASGPVSASPSPTIQATIRSRLSKCRAIGVGERITQLTAFMDRTRSLRGNMTWNAIGPRELPEKTSQALTAALHNRIRLRVGALEVAMRHKPGAAMPRAYDINHVQIVLFDQSIKVNIDKVQSRCRAPMPQQPSFYVFARQWDFE